MAGVCPFFKGVVKCNTAVVADDRRRVCLSLGISPVAVYK